MKTTWILIANSAHARCFLRESGTRHWSMLTEFDDPLGRAKGQDLTSDRSGHETTRQGGSGTAYAPHMDPRTKEHEKFAAQLARFCNEGVAAHRCDALAIFAAAPFLGEIKEHLDEQARKVLRVAAAHDFTSLSGSELLRRVDQELLAHH
jgi:protein required for attachment to host cells